MNTKIRLIACLELFLLSSFIQVPANAQTTYPDLIGVGVGMHQWTRPFIDVMKNSRGFEGLFGGPIPLDDKGYPLEDARLVLLEAWPVAEWWNDIDDPEKFHIDLSGTYRCSFTGQATVKAGFGDFSIANYAFNAATNTSTFDLLIPANANGLVILEFSGTRRTPGSPLNSGFTDFKAIRPGYTPNTTQIFTDEFLNAIQAACFSTLRFMNFTITNNINPAFPAVLEWHERKKPDAATYYETNDGAAPGGPWELVVELGNLTQKDIWVNVPVHATDDYVTQLANLVHDKLDPNLRVYVEYSNEVWNWGFWQAGWNLDKAATLGITHIQAYARRTAEIAQIFSSVFGPGSLNDRVRVVNCWQIGWWPPDWQMREQMEFIQANFGAPKNLIYALGVAPYFNCGDACDDGSVQEILDAMWQSSDDHNESKKLVAKLASDWELPGGMIAYEGGSDTGGGDTTNVANRILAERSEGMRDLMIHDLKDNWFPHGGGLFVYLELAGGYNRYGSWGLTDDVTNPDRNYKFEAVRTIAGDECLVGTTALGSHRMAFKIFPNPSQKDVNVLYLASRTGEMQLAIHDVYGRLLQTAVFTAASIGEQIGHISLQHLPAGTYFVSLSDGEKIGIDRLIIK
jgi:hypothetical protein